MTSTPWAKPAAATLTATVSAWAAFSAETRSEFGGALAELGTLRRAYYNLDPYAPEDIDDPGPVGDNTYPGADGTLNTSDDQEGTIEAGHGH